MKNSMQAVNDFVNSKSVAIIGVSRNKDKFGNYLYREMKKKGYTVYAINPNMDMFEGDRCYAGLGALPEKPEAVLMSIQPAATLSVMEEMARLGIKKGWLQQGADSKEGEEKAKELGLELVSGECMMMFMQPVESIHKFHRGFKKLFGQLPK